MPYPDNQPTATGANRIPLTSRQRSKRGIHTDVLTPAPTHQGGLRDKRRRTQYACVLKAQNYNRFAVLSENAEDEFRLSRSNVQFRVPSKNAKVQKHRVHTPLAGRQSNSSRDRQAGLHLPSPPITPPLTSLPNPPKVSKPAKKSRHDSFSSLQTGVPLPVSVRDSNKDLPLPLAGVTNDASTNAPQSTTQPPGTQPACYEPASRIISMEGLTKLQSLTPAPLLLHDQPVRKKIRRLLPSSSLRTSEVPVCELGGLTVNFTGPDPSEKLTEHRIPTTVDTVCHQGLHRRKSSWTSLTSTDSDNSLNSTSSTLDSEDEWEILSNCSSLRSKGTPRPSGESIKPLEPVHQRGRLVRRVM